MNIPGREVLVGFHEAMQIPDDPNDKTVVYDWWGQPCKKRMAAIHNATYNVMGLASLHPNKIPEPVKRFIRATLDNPCDRCWIESNKSKMHPDCLAKIEEWFRAREVLIQFAAEVANDKNEE